MALITWPSSPKPRSIRWTPPAVSQINRSGWTGAAQAVVLSGGLWRAIVELPPVVDPADQREWRAFVLGMQGQVNTTRLPAVAASQGLTTNTVRVNGGGQTGASLITDGWPASYAAMKRGHYLTLEGRLYVLQQDVSADGAGNDTVGLLPQLVSAPADNAIIEINNPYSTMRLANDDIGWTEDILTHGFAFDMIEAR